MEKRLCCSRHTPKDAQNELKVERRFKETLLKKSKTGINHSNLKYLQLRLNSLHQCLFGQHLQKLWRIEKNILPHIDRACIKGDQFWIEG